MYEKTEKNRCFFCSSSINPPRQADKPRILPSTHCTLRFYGFYLPLPDSPGEAPPPAFKFESAPPAPLPHACADSSDKQFLKQIHARKLPSFPQPVGQSGRHLESFRLQETQTGYIIR